MAKHYFQVDRVDVDLEAIDVFIESCFKAQTIGREFVYSTEDDRKNGCVLHINRVERVGFYFRERGDTVKFVSLSAGDVLKLAEEIKLLNGMTESIQLDL